MDSPPKPGESRKEAYARINALIKTQVELLDMVSDSVFEVEIQNLESELIASIGSKDAHSFISAMRKRRICKKVFEAPPHN